MKENTDTNAAQPSGHEITEKALLRTLEEYFTRLTGLKLSLSDTEIGIRTGIATPLNVGYALYLFWPANWSESGRQQMESYLPQVASWVQAKLAKVAGGEMANQPWVLDERTREELK